MNDYISLFIIFFAVIDPIGTMPVFLAVTNGFSVEAKRKVAVRAATAAALILAFFVVAGEVILNAMDIPLTAFQIAGGIVLFIFAMTMIFGESKPDEEIRMIGKETETAIFPLAVPSLASPGAMLAAVLHTENLQYSALQQGFIIVVIVLVLVVAMVLMLGATWIHRVIGDAGASVISRVMGLILSSVAVSNVLDGLKAYFAS